MALSIDDGMNFTFGCLLMCLLVAILVFIAASVARAIG